MSDPGTTETVASTQDMHERMQAAAAAKGPSFFRLRARLPTQGRADTLMAASPTMSVVLKTYAQGGENGLHRHPNEDHMFVVLQGQAEFHGPNDEIKRIGRHDGAFLPHTAFYWFRAVGDEPLVMLRVGATSNPEGDVLERLGIDGKSMDGFSDAN